MSMCDFPYDNVVTKGWYPVPSHNHDSVATFIAASLQQHTPFAKGIHSIWFTVLWCQHCARRNLLMKIILLLVIDKNIIIVISIVKIIKTPRANFWAILFNEVPLYLYRSLWNAERESGDWIVTYQVESACRPTTKSTNVNIAQYMHKQYI